MVDFVAATDRLMSDDSAKDFEAAEHVFAFGDMVVREAWDVGTAAIDLPEFGMIAPQILQCDAFR